MEASFPPAGHPRPLTQPKRGKRQQESANQRTYVRALLMSGLGFYYRVKNMGTFDPVKKIYRKDYGMALVAIPDICGFTKKGRAVYIEVKNVQGVEKKKKPIFACKITDLQKEFLLRAHRSGAISGVAFTLEDALAIAHDDEVRYPRHPRTWLFLPAEELAGVVAAWEQKKKALSRLKQDPVASVVVLGGTQEPTGQEP